LFAEFDHSRMGDFTVLEDLATKAINLATALNCDVQLARNTTVTADRLRKEKRLEDAGQHYVAAARIYLRAARGVKDENV